LPDRARARRFGSPHRAGPRSAGHAPLSGRQRGVGRQGRAARRRARRMRLSGAAAMRGSPIVRCHQSRSLMAKHAPQYRRNENFEKGLQIRQALLGKEKIDTALWGADAFNQPMQQLTTEYCWGEIWSRPGLPRKIRSLLNIAMLSALNRSTELGVHVRAALKNDCTPEEIQEALLQAAVYAGVPAGVEGFRVASPIIRQHLENGQEAQA